jgi:hypothetical protein
MPLISLLPLSLSLGLFVLIWVSAPPAESFTLTRASMRLVVGNVLRNEKISSALRSAARNADNPVLPTKSQAKASIHSPVDWLRAHGGSLKGRVRSTDNGPLIYSDDAIPKGTKIIEIPASLCLTPNSPAGPNQVSHTFPSLRHFASTQHLQKLIDLLDPSQWRGRTAVMLLSEFARGNSALAEYLESIFSDISHLRSFFPDISKL